MDYLFVKDITIAVIAALSSSGVTSIIMYLIQRHDRKQDMKSESDSTQSKMLVGLGHDKLVYLTEKYLERGGITLKEKATLKAIYEPYHGLGGNGDGEQGYTYCQGLPVISNEEAKKRDRKIKRQEYGVEEIEKEVERHTAEEAKKRETAERDQNAQ